jgi:hypothetical protein
MAPGGIGLNAKSTAGIGLKGLREQSWSYRASIVALGSVVALLLTNAL